MEAITTPDTTGVQPARFFIVPGDTAELIILDDQPTFYRYEHHRGKKTRHVYVPCNNHVADCPLCAAGSPSHFVQFLSVIDLRSFTSRKSPDVEVSFSKKLLVVKDTQQGKIVRLAEQYGTLRGMRVKATRSGPTALTEIEFVSNTDRVEAYEYGENAVDCNPYDYEVMFLK